jgi:hypothetical protein
MNAFAQALSTVPKQAVRASWEQSPQGPVRSKERGQLR